MILKNNSTRTLKVCFEILKEFIEETVILLKKELLGVADYDCSRCIFISLKIKKDSFKEYLNSEELKLAVKLDQIYEIFSNSSDEESLEISTEDNRILFKIEGITKKIFKIPLLNIEDKNIFEDEFEFGSELKIPLEIFENILDNSSVIGKSILFKVINGKIAFYSSQDSKAVEIEMKDNNENKINFTSKNDSFETKYNLELMRKVVKTCKSLKTSLIKIYFDKNYPIKLVFSSDDELIEFSFIMGPVVS